MNGQVARSTAVKPYRPRRLLCGPGLAQVLGVVNTAGNFAIALCPILVGQLFEWTANWNLVLVFFAAVSLLGTICRAFVDPRNGIFKAANEASFAVARGGRGLSRASSSQ